MGCEVHYHRSSVHYSPPTSAKVVQAPRHKEVTTIKIIALGILNPDCRLGVWLASVTGRSPREDKALVTRGVGDWVDALEERKVCPLQETDHYF